MVTRGLDTPHVQVGMHKIGLNTLHVQVDMHKIDPGRQCSWLMHKTPTSPLSKDDSPRRCARYTPLHVLYMVNVHLSQGRQHCMPAVFASQAGQLLTLSRLPAPDADAALAMTTLPRQHL